VVDFEMFRPALEEALLNRDKKSNVGAKPIDKVMMFKILFIKRLFNLSDEQTEYQINDRQSFKDFMGLSSGDDVPDQNGYKDHIKIDNAYKLIDAYEVTSAEVHDSQSSEDLLREADKEQIFFGDSAYGGEKLEQVYEKFKVEPQICERAYRNRPLSDEQKAGNRVKSKTRSRVEHIFGFVTNSMHDFFSRCIGFRRIKSVIGLINLFYNMLRYEQIIRLQLNPVPVKS
jgi:IS5 family transposase